MKAGIILCFGLFVTTIGCNNREKVKAKIFERTQIDPQRLLIRYMYSRNNNSYTDSATVKNIIISTDSIDVIINPSNPGESIPDLN